MDCTMPVLGEHQVEDRQLIADLVVTRMNQTLSKTPVPSPLRPSTTQQPQGGTLKESELNKIPTQRPPPQGVPVQPQEMQSQSQELLQPQSGLSSSRPPAQDHLQQPAISKPQKPPKPPAPTTTQPRSQGQPSSSVGTLPQPVPQQKAQPHPQLNKSQSLTNAFGFGDSSFFRSSVNEDESKAETIRNLRKSFANLFSD